MHKNKKSEPKKILVRNTEKPVPKTRLIEEKFENPSTRKKLDTKTRVQSNKYKPEAKFESPKLNSALQIAKKIDRVEKTNLQKAKNASEIAFCEKVTRKINFPSDQAIYRDLIPLGVPTRSPPVLTSREPLPQKDKEPNLASFAKPREVKEFIYEPCVKPDRPQLPSDLNNLRIYKTMQLHQ